MEEKINRRFAFIINSAYFVLIGLIIIFIFKFLFPYLLPFIIGFLIAFALKPIAHWLAKVTCCNKRLCSAIIILIIYALIGIALWFLGAKLIGTLQNFFTNIDEYFDEYIIPFINNINGTAVNAIATVSPDFAPEANQALAGFTDSIQSGIGDMTSKAISWLTTIGGKIPNFLLSSFFAIMSSVFIIMDYHKITDFIVKQFPERYKPIVFEIKKYFSGTMLMYIKSYAILMVITFVELSVGFIIIGVQNPIWIAALISLCDALPVIGTGGIVLPWILIELVKGNYSFTIGLTIVYIIVSIVRNFIEPKVLSKQLGLHPLITLIAIYIGLKIMGVIGMIGFPILLQILVSLQKSGTLHLWKE